MRSRRTEPSIDAGPDPAPGIDATSDRADYLFRRGSAISAVNHQFRLAVAWRKHSRRPRGLSGRVRASSRSPTPNRSRESGRSSEEPPLSDDDQWPLCANTGHSPTGWRACQIDPEPTLPISLGTGGLRRKGRVGVTEAPSAAPQWACLDRCGPVIAQARRATISDVARGSATEERNISLRRLSIRSRPE